MPTLLSTPEVNYFPNLDPIGPPTFDQYLKQQTQAQLYSWVPWEYNPGSATGTTTMTNVPVMVGPTPGEPADIYLPPTTPANAADTTKYGGALVAVDYLKAISPWFTGGNWNMETDKFNALSAPTKSSTSTGADTPQSPSTPPWAILAIALAALTLLGD